MKPILGPLNLKLDMVTKDHMGYRITDSEGREIAIVISRGDIKQAAADARLFKSAPELLELLCELLASDHKRVSMDRLHRLLNFIMRDDSI